MEIRYTYIAEDGSEFDDEDECVAYEEGANKNLDSVVFFNDGFDILNSLQDIDYYTQFMLVVNPKRAKDLFDWLYGYCGMEKPTCELHEGDALFWDDEYGNWDSCKHRIEECQSLMKTLEKKALEVI